MKSRINRYILPFIALALMLSASCRRSDRVIDIGNASLDFSPRYATGFHIDTVADSPTSILTVTKPWQGADSVVSRLVIDRDFKRIVVMSSSHVAMLDALGLTDRIVGVSGKRFIANPKLKQRLDDIVDVGYDNNFDYEALLSCNPDVVLLYGVYGASPVEPRLVEFGIPFVYISDYIEESPQGKAEWVVALAEITGCRQRAIQHFDSIAARYDSIAAHVAALIDSRPTAMLNTPYRDTWFMPPSDSYMVRLINDAGGRYVYTGNDTDSSLPIDMEQALSLTHQADLWLNTGQCTTLAQLKAECPRFSDSPCVLNGNVFNNTRLLTPGGGNDFYESGIMHPDIILQDLVRIFHPSLAVDSIPLTYYTRLR